MSAAEAAPREPEVNAWAPDPWQQAVLDRALSGQDAVVVGGPGSGKTSVLGAISSALEADDRVLVLCQSRQRAAAFNDRYLGALRGVRRGSLAVTPVALAFAIVSGRALQRGTGSSPRLLSGSEQDRLFAELLRGEVSGEVPQAPWPASVPPQTRALTGFRTELRDLYMRCVEQGVTPEQLHRLADRHGIPVWHAAAEFFRTYADVKAATFRFGEAWDSSELLQQASALLEQEEIPERLAAVRWLLIDDTQDITPAAGHLLRSLARPEMTIVACGDPDVGVNSFRGGSPAMAVRLLEDLGRDAPRLLLRRSHRLLPAVREDARRVVGGIGVAGETAHRLFEDAPVSPGVSGAPGAHAGASAALGASGRPAPAVRVRLAPGGAEEGLLL
ncbi:MAG: AAA family ATPase, partial [Microbacteriaceae bacterium]|nr:AAA family ATPase [Microbacteriaceae bacterium]